MSHKNYLILVKVGGNYHVVIMRFKKVLRYSIGAEKFDGMISCPIEIKWESSVHRGVRSFTVKQTLWAVSSVGRTSALQAGGHRFKSDTVHQ